MKPKNILSSLSISLLICANTILSQTDAVLLHIGDNLEQVRVEARETESGRWLAIASGYRDKADSGWLKVALPEGYEEADIRVLGSETPSPFAGILDPSGKPEELRVDYPPSVMNGLEFMREDSAGGGAEAEIEEADIWAWDDSTLFFYNQYRGLQVIDMTNTLHPEWLDYFRYPAKGEDLYALDDGTVVIIGTGDYWRDSQVALQFLQFDGTILSLEETVELESGYYMDSRRYNDYLYVMTREWVEDIDPDGAYRSTPLIRLYTVSLLPEVEERVVDVQTFQGNGWLDAVLTAQQGGILLSLNKWYDNDSDRHYRWRSEVYVLVPGEDGIPVLAGIAPLSGIVHDKFKLNYRDGLLTAISQKADWTTGQFSRVSMLENFELIDGRFARVGSLDLAPGETLFATRFYDNTVYVVTFLLVDPLFAIDNSNPVDPTIAGELKVPGYSNYIEWVDSQLFAVGIEDSKLTVSIFDVADPANMSLKDRIFMNEGSWAYSEAQYDDQAISFFPEDNLLMLPFTTWTWESGEQVQAMQLISWDDTGLQLRGSITHLDTPRRGTLTGDTVVTVSGREVVTTDISDPDLPVKGGSATLAWNVQTLIPHQDYLLQLETSSSDYYGRWFWEYPYGNGSQADPVLYVTSLDQPNIPAVEVQLETGKLVGSVNIDGNLVLLQDVSSYPPDYWEVPEKQSLAVRTYDLSNPLDPVKTGEVILEDILYLGDSFKAHILSGGNILWASNLNNSYGFYYLDFWPGPMYFQRSLSYLVQSPVGADGFEILSWTNYSLDKHWSNCSAWYWEDPLLVASTTEYVEKPNPEGYPDYLAKSKLVAVDFTVPDSPVELPIVELPSNLVAIESLQDGINHYLYFEPAWNLLEVWGWDEAVAFKLIRQELYPENGTESSSYSMAWIPPFHTRNRSSHDDNISTRYLEIWKHNFSANRFEHVDEYVFVDSWFNSNAVKDPYFLQSTKDSLFLFEADAVNGAFDLLGSVKLDFPNVYGLQLEGSIMTPEKTYIPAGLYGVEVLDLDLSGTVSYERAVNLEASNEWAVLDSSNWQRAEKASNDQVGVLKELNWLFYPDSMTELDSTAEDGGDFWRESEWFGWYAYDTLKINWIHHMDHGLLYSYPSDYPEEEGLYFKDGDIGTFWTRRDTYPWVYSFTREEWLLYLEGSGQKGRRWFYGLKSGWF